MKQGLLFAPKAAVLALVGLGLMGCGSAQVKPAPSALPPVSTPAAAVPPVAAAKPETPVAPPAATQPAPAAAAIAPTETGEAKPSESPDGETWLRSPEGLEYRLEKLEKSTPFIRLSPNRVRTVWGPEIEVEREDDTYFYYRIYKIAQVDTGPTEEQLRKKHAEEIRQQLPAPLPEVDRLQGVDFGRGLPTRGQWRNGFEFADMNGDGFLDLVHGPARKGPRTPKIFLGNGKGDWHLWQEAAFPEEAYDYGDITVGDFNGDGRLDLFLGVHLLGLQALIGDGKGHFTMASQGLPWRTNSSEPMGFSSQQVQAVDFDGSRRWQVLALSEGPHMSGLPTEHGPSQGPEGVRLYRDVSKDTAKVVWERVGLKDEGSNLFGGDLQMVSGRNRAFMIGAGAMNPEGTVFMGKGKDDWTRESLPVPPKSYLWSVSPLRRAGSQAFDLVGVGMSFDSGLAVRLINLYRRERTGWVARTLWSEEKKNRGPVRVATGDFDGNGLDDVVALGADGQVWILLQELGDKWVLEKSPEIQGKPGCSGYGLRVQDLDGDGRPELALSWAGEANALNDPSACLDGGALHIWKMQPQAAPAQHP